MKALYSAALVAVAAIIAVSFYVLISPQPTTQMIFHLYPDLMPGQPMPGAGASCQYSSLNYSDHLVFCHVDRYGAQDISFNFNIQTRTIDSIGYLTMESHLTIGDLMIRWGKPTGWSHDDYSTTVYWGNTSAFIASRYIGPNSPVGVVFAFTEPELTDQWRGFR